MDLFGNWVKFKSFQQPEIQHYTFHLFRLLRSQISFSNQRQELKHFYVQLLYTVYILN